MKINFKRLNKWIDKTINDTEIKNHEVLTIADKINLETASAFKAIYDVVELQMIYPKQKEEMLTNYFRYLYDNAKRISQEPLEQISNFPAIIEAKNTYQNHIEGLEFEDTLQNFYEERYLLLDSFIIR